MLECQMYVDKNLIFFISLFFLKVKETALKQFLLINFAVYSI